MFVFFHFCFFEGISLLELWKLLNELSLPFVIDIYLKKWIWEQLKRDTEQLQFFVSEVWCYSLCSQFFVAFGSDLIFFNSSLGTKSFSRVCVFWKVFISQFKQWRQICWFFPFSHQQRSWLLWCESKASRFRTFKSATRSAGGSERKIQNCGTLWTERSCPWSQRSKTSKITILFSVVLFHWMLNSLLWFLVLVW